MPKLSRAEAAYLLGVSTDTLRRWEKEGKITSSRTEGGHRRYDLDSSPEEELVKDVLEIITVFSAKLQSMRSGKKVAALPENFKKLAELEQ